MTMVPLSLCGLLLILPLTSLAQECDLPGDSAMTDHYVKPNLTCTDNGLRIQLYHDYYPADEYDLRDSRIQLFYKCHSPSGNVKNDTVPNSERTRLDGFVYHVPLSPPFTSVSALCFVWGCYEVSTTDSIFEHYLINNVTCEYKAPVTEPTTEPTVPDATNPPLIVSDPYSSSILIPSPTGTVPAPTGTIPTPTTTPLPTDSSAGNISAVVVVVVILALAVVCVLVLLGIILRFQQVQRRKNYLMRYYNYSEPIDPYFSPIDINAKVKVAVSVVSVFDTFLPNPPPPDSTDDDRSEVLQGMNPNSDSSSVQSVQFMGHTTVNNNTMEPPPESTKEKRRPSVDDLNKEPNQKDAPRESDYESYNYLPVKNNPGYVIGNFQPSTIPVQGVQQQQEHGDYIPHADMTRTTPRTLYWNQNRGEPKPYQFRTQLSSSASSGYVTDVTTTPASDYYKPLMTPDPGMSAMKHLPSHLLQTEYPVFDSTQTIDEVLSEEDDADSVGYNLDEGGEFDAISGVSEDKYVESVFAECSLSLNPSHFEPINYDELVEPTSPTYVNTTPGAELYHSQLNDVY